MPDDLLGTETMTPAVKIWGTIFLVFQLLFAANNYGPQRIPGLNLFLDQPFVAHQVVHIRGDSAPVFFEDITVEAGLGGFQRTPVYRLNPSYLEVMAGGIAVGDFDGDGFEDIFLTNMPPLHESVPAGPPSTLFRNRGDGSFEDVTEEAGLTDIKGYPQGAIFFDSNNNGRQDLYVAAYGGGQLFLNEGGYFRDVTTESGLDLSDKCGDYPCYGSSVAVADFTANGYLDMFIVNNVEWSIDDPSLRGQRYLFPVFFHSQQSLLFQNNGDGTFSDVTSATGVTNADGKGLGAVWADFSGNNQVDLYVANDLSGNTLYLNEKGGAFRSFARPAGVAEIKSSMGVTAADYNNNGHFDIAITNLQGSKVSLFENMGNGLFEYATDRSGLGPSGRSSGWGIEFIDVDLDGHMDLVVAGGPVWDPASQRTDNLLFRNRGDGTFEDITDASGDLTGHHTSRGLAVLDIGNNGHPDLIVSNLDGAPPSLLRNVRLHARNWLKVDLEGTRSNRDGIGALLEVERTDGVRITQQVKAGSSYQSSGTRRLFVGLAESEIRRMSVTWPSGLVDEFHEVPGNAFIRIEEGTATYEILDHGSIPEAPPRGFRHDPFQISRSGGED